MAFKLISVLIFAFVAYEINAQAFIPTCKFQIQQLQTQISQAARESSLQVSSTRNAIQSKGSLTRFNIKTKIIALQNKIQQTVGPTAALCRNQAQAALGQLNLDFNLCYKNIELNQLNMQVSQINALKAGTSQLCAICAESNECVNGKMEEVRNQVYGIQAQVAANAADIADGSAECFQNAENVQLEIINNINNNFDACL